jgi:hypothetical protein
LPGPQEADACDGGEERPDRELLTEEDQAVNDQVRPDYHSDHHQVIVIE